MRILSITAQKPHSTGSGTYLRELVRSFDRAGHQQAVVGGIYRSDKVNFPDNVKFYPVFFSESEEDKGLADIPFPIVGMSDKMPYVSTRYKDLTQDMVIAFGDAFMTRIAAVINEFKPDIIISHHLFLLTAMLRNTFPNIKLYGVCHGTDLRQMANCPALQAYVRPAIARLDRVYALHLEQRKQLINMFGGGLEKRTLVIGTGYNSQLFYPDSARVRGKNAPIRICYAGKMCAAKGVNELLDVLEELSALRYFKEVPDFTVTLVGGCQDDNISRRLSQLPSCIQYLGQRPQNELASIFRQSDIFVLPSYFEGLSLVVIEAMASGMLPICTDLPGTKTWIDDNVANSNVRYIPMPPMASIDEPTEEGRDIFKHDLLGIIKSALFDTSVGISPANPPDTSKISWDAVAKKMI